MDDLIRSGSYIALRLPSELLKLVEIQPNSTISLGKYGTFQANHLIGRPFHLTYEILDQPLRDGESNLRPVPAAELHALQIGDVTTSDEAVLDNDGVDVEIVNDEGNVVMRTNQFIDQNQATQMLTLEDIEALKKADNSAGKDVIAKILESHVGLDKKTTFSLAKYTLRKSKKYMKRFTALPIDIPIIVRYIFDTKDSQRIMDIREETLSLIISWSNVHFQGLHFKEEDIKPEQNDQNRWLVVDETSGLLVAAMAEQMGILHSKSKGSTPESEVVSEHATQPDIKSEDPDQLEQTKRREFAAFQQAWIHKQELAMSGPANTITVVHQNTQPNMSLLAYLGYNVSNPDQTHPLYTSLKEISFLQLLHPEEDNAYKEPPEATVDQVKEMKQRQKQAYFRKRRRWQRTKAIVDETQAGGFAGLIVASLMAPASILHRLVPLLRGGAQVVVYSPTVEVLTELVDFYSKARKSAFGTSDNPVVPSEEFPVDPRLLIGVSLHTSKCRPWQVLPSRTHPKMSGRGGSEGYVFVGTKVQPAEGKIEARGAYKRRKLEESTNGAALDISDSPLGLIETENQSEVEMENDKEGDVPMNGTEELS